MEENESGQDKTEEPTEERRQEFREKGDVANSRELTSVLVFATAVGSLSFYANKIFSSLRHSLTQNFENLNHTRIDGLGFGVYLHKEWVNYMVLIAPIFFFTSGAAVVGTLLQTRFNISLEKLKPNFAKLNPISGIQRMFSGYAILELLKSVAKMTAVSVVAAAILYSEAKRVPALLNVPILPAWSYCGHIVKTLFWSVTSLLLLIAGIDFIYNFMDVEKKMRMTKQELKEEYRQRELDPLIKNRMRRLQRDIANRRTVENTRKATVLITNPTHYSIALQYEVGFRAPKLLAKGVDGIALNMREVAKAMNIPIVENRPLARALYDTVEVNQDIPESLYTAVSEVIRYVFKLKGIKITRKTAKA